MKSIQMTLTTALVLDAAFTQAAATEIVEEARPASSEVSSAPKTISIQEMLQTGPVQMKLHSLAMITQNRINNGIDQSFLPGFSVCAKDKAVPVRSITARLLGQHFIQGHEKPDPQAVGLLLKLAQDDVADVRYNAIYHGLTQMHEKSEALIETLIEAAVKDREDALLERIAEALINEPLTKKVLNRKLKKTSDIAYFEVYSTLTDTTPRNADRFLDIPSSRPRLYIFSSIGSDREQARVELLRQLRQIGIENPDLRISGTSGNTVFMLKTFLTRDYIAVEEHFVGTTGFTITQSLWLTPEIELQIDELP